jgi:two-component system, sensor histidine kinase and response regulator
MKTGSQNTDREGRKRIRVLAAEDQPVNRRLMELIFEDLGCELKLVNNGSEALNAIRSSHFELVLLDLQMPELDGFQTARAIAREFGSSAPPVYAVSADVSRKTQMRCFGSHIRQLIPKPLRRATVSTILDSITPESGNSMRASGTPESWILPEDLKMLMRMKQEEAIRNTLKLFVLDAADRLEALLRALKSRDAETVANLAHSLAGGAGQIGALPFSSLCRELEAYTKETGMLSMKRVIVLLAEFEDAEVLISNYLLQTSQSIQ